MFPVLCNFGIIQIYALAWVRGFAWCNWCCVVQSTERGRHIYNLYSFPNRGIIRPILLLCTLPLHAEFPLKSEGVRGAEAENVAGGKEWIFIRSDSHNQALCHINHWVSYNEVSLIIVFTFRIILRSNTISNNMLGIFFKHIYLNFLRLHLQPNLPKI